MSNCGILCPEPVDFPSVLDVLSNDSVFSSVVDQQSKFVIDSKKSPLDLVPPIFNFDQLKPVTMTIIIPYDVESINLPAIFALMPVTDTVVPENIVLQRKQGKIRLPVEFNKPGEILSMRYGEETRGIVRSERSKGFPHSITMDIGTSERIISIKLSRKLKLTGPTSYEIAIEAAKAVLEHLRKTQEELSIIQNNKETAIRLKDLFIEGLIDSKDEIENKILKFYAERSKGYSEKSVPQFIDNILQLESPLYTGTLEMGELECQMANILFNLGYPINQVAFAQVMNEYPFTCNFTNAKSISGVTVEYKYIKHNRYNKQSEEAQHTIRVNKSGHVRHSGPNLESMKAVYYAFMQRAILYEDKIKSLEPPKQQLRISGPATILSIDEWKKYIEEEDILREKIIGGDVPIAKGEKKQNRGAERNEEKVISIIGNFEPTQAINDTYSSYCFDYQPLLGES